MDSIFSFSRSDIVKSLEENGLPASKVKAIFRNVYKNFAKEPFLEGDISKRNNLYLEWSRKWIVSSLHIFDFRVSKYDKSVKFVFRLKDGSLVESVLMPEKTRITLCLSTQVGCRQACSFCHTGRMGLKRNLDVEEIIGQVMGVSRWLLNEEKWFEEVELSPSQRVSNIVFMGMGEPLDNVLSLVTAIKILMDPFGLGIAPKKITVSTAGYLPGIKEFLLSGLKTNLALSIHSVDSSLRSKLMPINKKFPLESVVEFLRNNQSSFRGPLFIQYTLMEGVNDSREAAESLVELLKGLPAKVNIIPFNPFDQSSYKAPSYQSIKEFQGYLLSAGIRSMVRFSKGQDIAAACGQLVTSSKKRQRSFSN